MSSWDSFVYQTIQKLKSKTSLSIFNTLTNNEDLIQICNHVYLGNVKAVHNQELLEKNQIEALVNCTNDIPIHVYFKNRQYKQLYVEDSKDNENMNTFKNIIIETVDFINDCVKQEKNVIVHCYWGLMRSPCVIGCYLIYKYKMDVDGVIQLIQSKKNFAFTHIYNFRELLDYVYDYYQKKNKELLKL